MVSKGNHPQMALFQDVEAHHVTMLDQATTMAKMWHQCMLWLPRAACPTHKRGLNTSLYTLGFLQQTSGVSPRPAFYQQDETIHFLLGTIKGMSNYNVSFHVHWLQPRKQPMVDEDWTQKCDKLKYGRRAMKLRRWGFTFLAKQESFDILGFPYLKDRAACGRQPALCICWGRASLRRERALFQVSEILQLTQKNMFENMRIGHPRMASWLAV